MADSEKYFTKTVDGQLSVATVAQTGEIIPEEDRPGDKYTTALVQTDDGPQLCVKTYDLNGGGGGGGGGTVDQTYDPASTNAQSGTAVAEAVQPCLQNTATGAGALTILGTSTSAQETINIGEESKSTASSNSYPGNVVIGTKASGSATMYTGGSVAIGGGATASNGSIAIGAKNNYYSLSGAYAAAQGAIAIGTSQYESRTEATRSSAIAIGKNAKATAVKGLAIGADATASAEPSIQLGGGTNSTANSFQVFNYQMLDGTTGKIPAERLPGRKMYRVSGFSADNYILLNYIPTGAVANYEIEVVAQYIDADHTYSGLLGNASGNYNIPQLLANNSNSNLNFNHPLAPFSSCPQFLPASKSFPVSQLFA